MWRICYHVVPKPNSQAFQECGGAYVNCWILFAWQDGAEYLAKYEVEKEWIITETDEISWVEIEDLSEDVENKEYFLQAQTDGGCFVFYRYPLNAEEPDGDFEDNVDSRVLRTKH
jgi:hypothetical protein